MSDNNNGDFTIMHHPNSDIGKNDDKTLQIKAGDEIKLSDGRTFTIGKNAYLEELEQTPVMQLLMHDINQQAAPDTLARLVFEGMEPKDEEWQYLSNNHDIASMQNSNNCITFTVIRDGQEVAKGRVCK